jgi:hypothetical protein
MKPTAFQSAPAGADLSAKQYFFVKLNSDREAILTSAATDKIAGVLSNEPEEDEDATIITAGTAKVSAGGTLSIGDYVTSDSAGEAVATTTSGDVVRGIALEDAVDGDISEIDLTYFHHK